MRDLLAQHTGCASKSSQVDTIASAALKTAMQQPVLSYDKNGT